MAFGPSDHGLHDETTQVLQIDALPRTTAKKCNKTTDRHSRPNRNNNNNHNNDKETHSTRTQPRAHPGVPRPRTQRHSTSDAPKQRSKKQRSERTSKTLPVKNIQIQPATQVHISTVRRNRNPYQTRQQKGSGRCRPFSAAASRQVLREHGMKEQRGGGGGRIVAGCSGTLCPAASTSYVEAVEDTQDGLFPHFVELWLQYSRVLGNLWFLWKNDASFPRPTRSCHTRYHGIASNRR